LFSFSVLLLNGRKAYWPDPCVLKKCLIVYIVKVLAYYYILHLSAKRYKELLAIQLRKLFMDKNLNTLPLLLFCAPLCLFIIVGTIVCFTYYKKTCSLAWTSLVFYIKSTALLSGLRPLALMQAFGTALLCSMLAVVCYRSVEARARLSPCLSRISTLKVLA
jgi:hypothetical protein